MAASEWGVRRELCRSAEIRRQEIRMGAGSKCRVVPVAVSRASGQYHEMMTCQQDQGENDDWPRAGTGIQAI